MRRVDLAPGEVVIFPPQRVEVSYGRDGRQLPYAIMRRHTVGRCIHSDGSCDFKGATLEAYAEWPCRGSFASSEEFDKACESYVLDGIGPNYYESLEQHFAIFFEEFDAHNKE